MKQPTQKKRNAEKIMISASRSGHLHILKWVFSHHGGRLETSPAINMASRYGRLKVVIWLNKARKVSKPQKISSPDKGDGIEYFPGTMGQYQGTPWIS
mmetsp:Transcript_798/g.1165  ORF Transcript_798/g.1165 Transcript_798/m.1165 type:complete len:98 (-) Transcript_798:256-549(-)